MGRLFEQINTEKKIFRLGDLVRINERSLMSNFEYSEIEYIDTSSVTENRFNKSEVLSVKDAPSRAKRLVRDGDTIISTVRPNLKHYGFVKKPNENTVVSTGFAVLTPKLIDPFYLFSYLTKDSVTNTLAAIAEATTTTFPAFRPEVLADMEITVPKISTQKKIAEILSAYDSKIDNNNFIVRNLELMGRSIFDEWFIKGGFAGDAEDQKVITLSEILDINPTTQISENSARHADMKDLSEFIMYFSPNDAKVMRNGGSRFKNHDTLLARITPCLENGKTGYVNCLNKDEVATGSTEFLVLRPKTKEYREFIYFLARDEQFRNFAIGRMVGSSGRQRVTGDDVSRFKLTQPDYDLILKFHAIFEPVFENIQVISEENKKMRIVRDRLLAKLI